MHECLNANIAEQLKICNSLSDELRSRSRYSSLDQSKNGSRRQGRRRDASVTIWMSCAHDVMSRQLRYFFQHLTLDIAAVSHDSPTKNKLNKSV